MNKSKPLSDNLANSLTSESNRKPANTFVNMKTGSLLLLGLILFSQISQMSWPYFAREYAVLIFFKFTLSRL